MQDNLRNFSYTDLSLTDGAKAFDGMASGRFIDMWGRETVFLPEELSEYVRNTKLALASTMDAGGQVVGFPIDGMNHDGGLAAGWIVDVELAPGRDVIEFTPRWNERGRASVGADELRFFSPTVDTEKKVIIGGSLTNWPATRTADHQILLRPVELSASMQTYTTAPIVTLGDVLKGAISELKHVLAGLLPDNRLTPETGTNEGAEPMEIETPEVAPEAEETAAPIEAPETEPESAPAPESPAPAELASPVTIAHAGGEPVVDLTSDVVQAMITERAEQRALALIAQREHDGRVTALAARLAGGTPEQPKGLPIAYDRVRSFLAGLSTDQYQDAEAILTAAVEHAPIKFDEAGHSRVLQGTQPLPDAIKPVLADWLARGLSMSEFFEINAVELGSMSDYNLTEFLPKE